MIVRDPQQRAVDELGRARARILGMLDEVTDAQLQHQWTPLLSPMVWDLGHVGNYEDLWLVQTLAGERVTPAGLDELYDAFQQPRAGRRQLPLLGPNEARAYIASVRERSLRAIEAGLLDPERAAGEQQLVRDAFVLGLIIQHEHQHAETILQARQAMGVLAEPLHHARGDIQPVSGSDPGTTTWLAHAGGTGTIGTSTNPWAYDNERPAHQVTLEPFLIARDPVTNAQWLLFMADGGYEREELWDAVGGRAWLETERPEAPLYWQCSGDGAWQVLRFGSWRDIDPAEPVQHVSFWEADAFARWSQARLPTELEWEAAASWAAADHTDAPTHELAAIANVGVRTDGPVAADAVAEAVSPCGCRSMLGNVWEWTSSIFRPWPGFEVFPYAEYSEAFFDQGYRTLRGGSWATDPETCRTTFRNWDHPERRQLFAGLRIARDR